MVGDKIMVVYSPVLKQLRLTDLVGQTGRIVCVSQYNNGAFVKFDKPYLAEDEWFIPRTSMQKISNDE